MGNFKFRGVKLDIFILNTYSVKPLSLSTGKKGQPGAHFNGKYQQEMNFIFQQETTSQIGGRSFWLYEHPHFKYILCKTLVSLHRKEGTTKGSFQWEITGLQYLAYLSGKISEEAELDRKEGVTRIHFIGKLHV